MTNQELDQAAGLRAWAAASKSEAPHANTQGASESGPSGSRASASDRSREKTQNLLVIAHPYSTEVATHASEAILRYHQEGRQWVGDPNQWNIVVRSPLDEDFLEYAQRFGRWALWLDTDVQGFQRAYHTLKDLQHRCSKTPRMLLMHPPVQSRRGLVNNVQQIARDFFQIELLVLQRA